MKKLILFSILILLCTCKKQNTQKEFVDYYVISKTDSAFRNHLKSGKLLPPPPSFYNRNNLIIDKNDSLYFYKYKFYNLWNCIDDPNDTLPLLINIEPDDLLNVSVASIKDIINRQKIEKNRCKLVIASQKDSIKNKELLKYFKEINLYHIRRTTQEEDTVLHYKTQEKLYIPEDIKWDYTKLHKICSERRKR